MENTFTVEADAQNRAFRTLVQGLMVDVLIAVAAGLLLWLPNADLTSKEAWIAFGVGLGKSVLTAIASYAMRKFKPPLGDPDRGDVSVRDLVLIAVVVAIVVILVMIF